jgi:ribose transport system permease protein
VTRLRRLSGIPQLLIRLQHRFSFAFALLLTLALLVAVLRTETGGFGLSDQLANFAPLAVIAMASTVPIIGGGGGIDISLSPLMTLASVIFVAWLVPNGLGGAVAVPIVLAISTAIGVLSGLLISWLRVPPIVLTLAMYFVLGALAAEILAAPRYMSASWVSRLAGHIGPVPGAVFTLGVPLVVWVALGRVPYRRTLYAVGSNDAAAFAAGINVHAARVAAYGLGGLFAGVGAFALTAVTLSADATQASTYTLVALAAVALGGTSLWGGRGGLLGSLLGAAAIYLLQDVLVTLQISTSWLQVVYGGALVVAVVIGGVVARQALPA